MTPKSPSAVLIHGHHLQAPGWETLVWGEQNLERVGRIPRGIELAIKEDAGIIIWGTAASTDPATGKKESEYTQTYALDHADELAAYTEVSKEKIIAFIQERSLLQLETKNTKDEIHEAMKVCHERGIHTLYLISSPTHVPRCLLTAVQYQEAFPGIVLCGVAADTSMEFWHPKDVAVVEPSHRPDRSEVPMNLLAKRMASARKYPDKALQLHDNIKKALDVFDREKGNNAG